jgi:hypothetical protein
MAYLLSRDNCLFLRQILKHFQTQFVEVLEGARGSPSQVDGPEEEKKKIAGAARLCAFPYRPGKKPTELQRAV